MDLTTGIFGAQLLSAVFLFCALAICLPLVSLALEARLAERLFSLGRRALFVAAGFSVFALVVLTKAFLTDNFSISAVSHYSSRDMLTFYKVSAVWAGAAGSLLLWAVLLLVLFAFWLTRLRSDELKFNTIALTIGSVVCFGFAALLVFIAKPFASPAEVVQNGTGLNPLLRNVWMISHPPLLFIGYSAFLIPFAIVIASSLAGRSADAVLYRQLRWWLLFGICFLTLGIATGARWSYFVLGWGGYWAWDPVENASLLPWLLAIVALHSLAGIGGAKKVRRWIVFSAPVTFILCLVATFITRSSVLQSVHAFGDNAMFSALLVFIAVCILLWLAGMVLAGKSSAEAAPEPEENFRLKRSDLVVWVNIILVFTAVVIGVATFWPVFSRIASSSGSMVAISRTFYDRLASVIGVLLALWLGFAALTYLQKSKGFIAQILICVLAGLICAGLVSDYAQAGLLLAVACGACGFSFVAILMKILNKLNNRSKIGGSLAHVGLLLLVVCAGFSSKERVIGTQLARGEKIRLAKFELTYDFFEHKFSDNINKVGPQITIAGNGVARKLWPHNNIFESGMKTVEAAVYSGIWEDVYILFDSVGTDGKVSIEVKVIPMMSGLWAACLLIIGGCAVAIFESKRS